MNLFGIFSVRHSKALARLLKFSFLLLIGVGLQSVFSASQSSAGEVKIRNLVPFPQPCTFYLGETPSLSETVGEKIAQGWNQILKTPDANLADEVEALYTRFFWPRIILEGL